MTNPDKIQQSVTVAINSIVQDKILSGQNVINLSVGEPKLPMHELLVQSAIDAMKLGKIFYPPVSGVLELKSVAIDWMRTSYNCHYSHENTLVVNGGKQGIYLLLQLLLSKDDEVIIISPYWVSYPAITNIFDGKSVIIETSESEKWKINPDCLRKTISPKSKVLIINNGSNPTGVLYTKDELENILKIAKENNLLVISDEVYSGLTYDDNPYISCGSFADFREDVVVIQSCSKNFSMTGWRVG